MDYRSRKERRADRAFEDAKLMEDHIAYLNSLDNLPSGWIASTQPTKLRSTGKYRRPQEEPPIAGYLWNVTYGVWVPSVRLLHETSIVARHTSKKVPTTSSTRSKPPPPPLPPPPSPPSPPPTVSSETETAATLLSTETARQGTNQSSPVDLDERKSSSSSANRKRDATQAIAASTEKLPPRSSTKKARKMTKESTSKQQIDTIEEVLSIDNITPGNYKKRNRSTTSLKSDTQQCQDTKQQQETDDDNEENVDDEDMFHPNSMWQEPYTDDLTLYERHRTARPAPTGTIIIPMDIIRPEIRCVICLDILRNTQIVRECLHRFCESCIEQALTHQNIEGVGGRRKECPICRIYLPSRRSLAPDTQIDTLISGLLDNLVWEEEDDPKIYLQSLSHLKGQRQKSILNTVVNKMNTDAGPSQQPIASNLKEVKEDVATEHQQQLIDSTATEHRLSTSSSATTTSLAQVPTTTFDPIRTPGLIKIVLIQRANPLTSLKHFDDLIQPYITLASDASASVIKKFLCRKHGFDFNNSNYNKDSLQKSSQLQHKLGCRINNILLWTMYKEEPYIIKVTDNLRFLLLHRTDPFHGQYMPLYYRYKATSNNDTISTTGSTSTNYKSVYETNSQIVV